MRNVVALFVLCLALFIAPITVADTITICKTTIPAGGTGFPFAWQNGSGGPVSSFILNDGQCKPFDVTQLDHFNKFTENVPAGWSLTNIVCSFTTSSVSITGANPNAGFDPGDTTVNIDLNEQNVKCTFTDQALSQPMSDVYAVKFLCGSFRPVTPTPLPDGVEWPVKPGNYLTAINVHNPNHTLIGFRKKAVLLYRADKPPKPEEPMPPGQLRGVELKPDWGLEIDCADIRNQLLGGSTGAPTFIKGWVIIEVPPTSAGDPLPLDVTAVYTSHGWNRTGNTWTYVGFAEDVEAVLPKRVK